MDVWTSVRMIISIVRNSVKPTGNEKERADPPLPEIFRIIPYQVRDKRTGHGFA
jgi:hypothetical protein